MYTKSRRLTRQRFANLLVVVSFVFCACPFLVGQEWSRFRGDNGNARVPECSVPLPWNEEDIRWRAELPGKGNSSPIVSGNRVFVLSADPETAEVYALGFDLKTGEELWKRSFASQPHQLHVRSSYASCTPCASSNTLYFAWASPNQTTLKALSHDGEEKWSKDLGRYSSQHGFGASPVLIEGKLILLNSQTTKPPEGIEPGFSRVMAFDPETGNLLWEHALSTTNVCYGVPAHFKSQDGRDALLFSNTGNGVFALDLETGEELWSKVMFTLRTVSSPLVVGDLAIATEGSGGGGRVLYAVNMQGDHEEVFRIARAAPYVPTPVVKDNLLFMWSDDGIASCARLPSGEVLWSKRIGGNVSTSPVIAGEKLVGVAEDGTVTVLAASEEFHEYGTVSLGEVTRATPAVTRDCMIFRSNSQLVCVGGL